MLRNLKISHKVTVGFSIVILLTLISGIVSFTSLTSISSLIEKFYNHPYTISVNATQTNADIIAMHRSMKDVALANNAAQVKEASDKVDALEKKVYAQFAVINRQFLGDKQIVQKAEELFKQWKPTRDEVIALSLAGKKEEAAAITKAKGANQVAQTLTAMDDLIQFANSKAQQFTNDAEDQSKSAITFISVIFIFSLVFAVLITIYIVRGITHSLTKIKSEIDMLSERGGDLTQEIMINTKDEIGEMSRSMNTFIASLRDIISHVKNNSGSVAAASQQIAAASEEVASASNEQAVSAQSMNELFKELAASIQVVASNAESAADLSTETAQVAKEGGEVIHSSIEGMNLVNQHITRLEEDSNKIGDIIEVIDEIADQTNLLALNAAIEAARAGDQGRGFAVVADEVRKLAERSGEATKQITIIIKGMQRNTENSVHAVNEGVYKSQQTNEAFSKILTMVVELSQRVSEIAAACEEQSAQSNEVIKSIETIAATSEESAASAEESSSASQSLAQLAEELQGAVAKFKV